MNKITFKMKVVHLLTHLPTDENWEVPKCRICWIPRIKFRRKLKSFKRRCDKEVLKYYQTCCNDENRNMNGGCTNCGDPSL